MQPNPKPGLPMPTPRKHPWRRAFSPLVCAATLTLIGRMPVVAQAAAGAASPAPALKGIDSIWQQHANQPDLAWRDPTSHARVVNVTAGFANAGLPYFHQNVFTAAGDLMLFTGRRDKDEGYYILDLRTGEIRHVSSQTGANLVVLPRRRAAAFRRGLPLYLTTHGAARCSPLSRPLFSRMLHAATLATYAKVSTRPRRPRPAPLGVPIATPL